MTASGDRVTEVGIVRVEGSHATEWSSLVNPDCSIPPAIQAPTGISNAMVAKAPRFADIASDCCDQDRGLRFRRPRRALRLWFPEARIRTAGPGVHRFYGLNPMPLYVGKSVHLRERVASYFSSDYRSANDMRLSSELVRIETHSLQATSKASVAHVPAQSVARAQTPPNSENGLSCPAPHLTFSPMSRIATSEPSKPKLPWIVGLTAPQRLSLTLLVGAISFAVTQPWLIPHTRLLIAWNAGTLTYLIFCWLAVARADAHMTRLRAQLYDQTGYVIFLLVVVASSASIVAIGFLVGDAKQLPFAERAARLSLSICALLLSWLLIHTLFAFHYARCYYWREEPSKEHIRGLRFPGESEPDYLDFVYYSFVVGMTSQVSDVAVVARHMRRITLIHGVLSFVFNIAILAMSINIIGGMI